MSAATIQNAVLQASQVLPGSLEFYVACSVCELRGLDPHAYSEYRYSQLTNWQSLIAQTILVKTLMHMLPNGDSNG